MRYNDFKCCALRHSRSCASCIFKRPNNFVCVLTRKEMEKERDILRRDDTHGKLRIYVQRTYKYTVDQKFTRHLDHAQTVCISRTRYNVVCVTTLRTCKEIFTHLIIVSYRRV